MHTSDARAAQALWLDEDTFAVPASMGRVRDAAWELCFAASGGISVRDGAVTGADGFIPLVVDPTGLSAPQRVRDPYLSAVWTPDGRDYRVLRPAIPLERKRIERILTGQVAIVQSVGPRVTEMTQVQCARILDVLYAPEASQLSYGPVVSGDAVTIRVWAPTARDVRLCIGAERHAMRRMQCGAWEVNGGREWCNEEYSFEVSIYVPHFVARPSSEQDVALAGKVQTFRVVDPMATGLTLDGRCGVVVDLKDPTWMPENWLRAKAVGLRNPSERAIYELHVRDYSIADMSVPEKLRGTYAAFTCAESAGHRALAQLRAAGMNTIHLLPTYDIGTIPENRAKQLRAHIPADVAPDSESPQAAIAQVADSDGYNWGYDPVHYGVPEGSYASLENQEGGARVVEFRSMIGALHELGYHVILDQVFNHTYEYGLAASSVFEKIVPGYYYRLGYGGETLTTPCSGEFASEHAMAEKFMSDTLLRWACDYRADGFRFDLMEFHSVETMTRIQRTLAAAIGHNPFLYGEGWPFGSTADGSRFTPALQETLAGTGIATFNDRVRDALRGTHPCDRGGMRGLAQGIADDDGNKARELADAVRIALAGNLRHVAITAQDGTQCRGEDISILGKRCGYCEQPHEALNYVDAHDNETLFDFSIWRMPPGTPMDARIRMNTLALAAVTLGQSPCFWHAGTELLRSKSLDADSYNSGDWFNALDWTGRSNRFGVGLPPANRNAEHWDAMRPLLRNPNNRPNAQHIAQARRAALMVLRLRSSSPLLTLGSAELIEEMVSFPGANPRTPPGFIAMRIYDWARRGIDPRLAGVLLVFNFSGKTIAERLYGLAGTQLQLSPICLAGDDVVKETQWDEPTGTVIIPGYTVAVFEQPWA